MPASTVALSPSIKASLQCPICQSLLKETKTAWCCTNPADPHTFPVVDGIPVLINDQASIFAVSDYLDRKSFIASVASTSLKRSIAAKLPTLSGNLVGPANYAAFGEALLRQAPSVRVLVVGGRTVGQGLDPLLDNPQFEFVETDVGFGPRVQVICDGHDLPFADGTFDGVIVQAVLEHVADPPRCVAEIHRVLKPGGVVYAETPFMQQVHGGAYDFTRYTHLGHRRLFRGFEEIDSGPIGGPGMALAWSYRYFLQSWTTNRLVYRGMDLFARLTGFWLKYCDRQLMRKPSAFDNGWAYYFLGTKADQPLTDRELVRRYRGAQTR